jgi:hypothetical protein
MSNHYSSKWSSKTSAEKCDKWMQWFEKRYEKLFKDAAERGKFSINLDLPIKADSRENRDLLRSIRNELRERLPGCEVAFVEEDYEQTIHYTLEISWKHCGSKPTESAACSAKDDSTQDSTAAPTSTQDNPPPAVDLEQISLQVPSETPCIAQCNTDSCSMNTL